MSNKSIPEVANGKCREYVRNMKEFDGSNLFARYTRTDSRATPEIFYVVYSYGGHYPLFIYHCSTKTWFENEDRYSVTTSKHRSQAHPLPPTPTKKASTKFMRRMLDVGLVLAVQEAA